jgi:type VI secretion system secreted protein Hcp
MPIYIKLDGIDGEVTAAGYEKWIEVLSFSWGVTQQISSAGGGGGAGKASFQDIHFQQKTQKSSPNIVKACATGQHIKFGELDFIKGERSPNSTAYLKIKLEDVLVSSIQWGGAEGSDNDVPSESIGLNFAKFEFDFVEQNADGSLGNANSFAFDISRNAVP